MPTDTSIPARFAIHSRDTAPAASKSVLDRLKTSVGMVPNLAAAMAESPTLIDAFVTLREIFGRGSFAPVERELLLLTNAVENGCRYCAAIHSTFGMQAGLSREDVARVRAGGVPQEARLAALCCFDRKVLRERGRVAGADLAIFEQAGFTRAQALEVLAAAAMSSMANYAGRMTQTPPDEAIRANYE